MTDEELREYHADLAEIDASIECALKHPERYEPMEVLASARGFHIFICCLLGVVDEIESSPYAADVAWLEVWWASGGYKDAGPVCRVMEPRGSIG